MKETKAELSWPSILLYVSLLIHLSFLLSLKWGFLNPFFHDPNHTYGPGADFFALYQAGHNALNGTSLYSDLEVETKQGNLIVPYFYPFRYLPIAAYTVGIVLTVCKPWTAYYLWLLFYEILLSLNIFLTWQISPDRKTAVIATAFWLAFSPYYLELYMGQFSFFMGTFIFLMGYGYLTRKSLLFDTAWLASALLKLNTLLMAPFLLRLKKIRPIILFFLLAILSSVAYFYKFPADWTLFLDNLKLMGTFGENFHSGNHGLQSLLYNAIFRYRGLSGSDSIQILQPLTLPIILFILGTSLLMTFLPKKLDVIENLALWMTAYFLIYKHVWEHHYVMLLPAFILLYVHEEDVKSEKQEVGRKNLHSVFLLIIYLLLALPTPFYVFNRPGTESIYDPSMYWTKLEDFLYHLAKPLPSVLLYGYLVYLHLEKIVITQPQRHGGHRGLK
jgi:hypothetical protein